MQLGRACSSNVQNAVEILVYFNVRIVVITDFEHEIIKLIANYKEEIVAKLNIMKEQNISIKPIR
jgi:hypothetical protein